MTLSWESPTLAALTLRALSPLPNAAVRMNKMLFKNGLSLVPCMYLPSTPQTYQLVE